MSDLLQTIKDQVSNEKWPANFDDLHVKYREELWPEVCKRYAFEVAKDALKNASENVVLDSDYLPSKDYVQYYVNMNSITDESNIKL